jgi:hypothetical protein
MFKDEESGVDHYKMQIYEKYQGTRRQIVPCMYWEEGIERLKESCHIVFLSIKLMNNKRVLSNTNLKIDQFKL